MMYQIQGSSSYGLFFFISVILVDLENQSIKIEIQEPAQN